MPKKVSETISVCPFCLKTIPADIVEEDDKNIYMQKTCPEHGFFNVLIWEGDLDSYQKWGDDQMVSHPLTNPKPTQKGCPNDCGLCENHKRNGCCVLLELTDCCNLQCPVCFASAKGEGTDLSLEQIHQQYDYLMEHGGPFNIQLSGGEPTLRNDLDQIVLLGKEKGFTFFQLNTNGIRIAEEEGYAQFLKEIGISCVFLQFDSLCDCVYQKLRGKPLLSIKEQAIQRCKEAGLPVVLVPVIAPEINEQEMGDLIQYAMKQAPSVRGIHFQPLSYFGRCQLEYEIPVHLTIPRILSRIEEQTNGLIRKEHFKGGGAENPYCSFHAAYRLHEQQLRPLPQKQSGCCGIKSEESMNYVSQQWGNMMPCGTDIENVESSSLDLFLQQAIEETFTISGMLFQDAWNLDQNRLQRCYICESDSRYGMVPFCAYNLTDQNGKALYRK